MKPTLADSPINVRLKLAGLWTSLMFLYIYADYFGLMTPDSLQNMMELKTPVGRTTPGLLIIFSILLIIPALMIALSLLAKPLIVKILNIFFGIFYGSLSVLIIISDIGHSWQGFFVLYQFVELAVFGIIVWQAWKWPKLNS